jgi:gliding motility-associated-like protein
MRSIFIISFSFLMTCSALGQNINEGLVAYFPFDGYPIVDKSGNGNRAIISGDSLLACGVVGNSIRFDGLQSSMLFIGPLSFDNFKTGPFSISFYFKASNQTGNSTLDLFSKRRNCTPDSSFAIRYTPATNQLSVEVSENVRTRNVILQRLDFNRCWQHIVVVRDFNKLSLYVNGRLAQVKLAPRRVNISNTQILSIAQSPCLQTTDRKFSGFIDELRVYDRVLTDQEVTMLYTAPDRIANRDTIMFLGSSIDMRITRTCASAFQWSPRENLNNWQLDTARFTPIKGGTYKYVLTMKEPQCTALDTVEIKVIDPKDLDCAKVFLPNAFTPNGDGLNNEFFISNPFAVEELVLFEVYDAWGAKMFATTDKFAKWDGRFQGKELNPGVYVWKVRYRCKGEEQSDFGSVTIIK